nr:HEPN domain-containing protein [Rhodovibrio sodomensis]
MDKSRRLRAEAEAISPTQAPSAVISACYYAAFHAAIAALLAVHGTAPTKHGTVHDALAKLAKAREPEADAAAIKDALERAYEMRIRADYEPDARPEETRVNAERISELRDTVIAFCDRVIDGG